MSQAGHRPLAADMLRPPPPPPLVQHARIRTLSRQLPEAVSGCFQCFGMLPVRASVESASEEPLAAAGDEAPVFRWPRQGNGVDFVVAPDRTLVFALTDFACGGAGIEPPFGSDRPFSRFEEDLRNRFVTMLAARIAVLLDTSLALGAAADGESPVALTDLPVGARPHLVFRLLIIAAGYDAELRIGVAMDRLTAMLGAPAPAEPGAAAGETLRGAVNAAEARLIVTLPDERIPVARLATLRPGQFLELSAAAGGPVQVSCEGAEMFSARLARSGERLAIRIEGWTSPRNVAASSAPHL